MLLALAFSVTQAMLAAGLAHDAGATGDEGAAPHVIYLAVDGERIDVTPQRGVDCQGDEPRCGKSDSRTNESWLPAGDEAWIDVPAFDAARHGDPAAVRRALVEQVAQAFEGLNVRVTDVRPSDDEDYTMVVVGGRGKLLSLPKGIAGFAPLDCGNDNPNDVAFAFSDDIAGFSALVRVIAQEAGHTYGLEHVTEPEFIMYPTPGDESAGFSRTCVPIVPDSVGVNPDGIKCIHSCPSLQHQDAYGELSSLLGLDPDADAVDLTPPTVSIIRPAPGQYFAEVPASFRVEIAASDDVGVGKATISVQGAPEAVDPTYPFAFDVHGWGAGRYAIEIAVQDAAGNVSRDQVDVFVGDDPDAGAGSVPAGSVTPYLEPSGDPPPRCSRDAQCPAGTECLDGVCLRPQLDCGVGPAGGRAPWAGFALFALLGLRLRRRSTMGA